MYIGSTVVIPQLPRREYLLTTYGLNGEPWTPDANGNPIPTDRGKADSTVRTEFQQAMATAGG